MAEETGKPKKASEANVLASLPSTRPNRLGRRGRDGASTTAKAASGTRAKATATKAAGAAAKAKPKATARKKAAPAAVAKAAPKRPQPVRSASKNLTEPAKKSAAKRKPAPPPAPGGTELVSTVVQAAGELASVGLSIGGQIIKRAVDRLPKP